MNRKNFTLSPTTAMVRVYPMGERLTRADLLLAENLRALIAARRIDARTVAQACGHAPAWISKILNGDRGMRVQDVGKVAGFFGLTVSELFSPGISAVTERRRRTRRADVDRRLIQDRRANKLLAQGQNGDVILPRPAMKGGSPSHVDGDSNPATLAPTSDLDARITAAIIHLRELHTLRAQALASSAGQPAASGSDSREDAGRAVIGVAHRRPTRAR